VGSHPARHVPLRGRAGPGGPRSAWSRRDEHEQYREQVLASLAACPWARVIKASDFTGNAVGIIHIMGPELSKLAGKYSPPCPDAR
jgi:hypothetical protein